MAKKKKRQLEQHRSLSELFPLPFRGLLSATGKQFMEHTGPELVRQATLQILLGQNVRTQTEPLTRQRIAEVSGALIELFRQGIDKSSSFFQSLSQLAVDLLRSGNIERASLWPAQWALGLTGKGVQNVLRGDGGSMAAYLASFDIAIEKAARNLDKQLGQFRLTMTVDTKPEARIDSWQQMLRLTTVLGCAELAIRGSDKSRYGKLFERLVLGSVLVALGFDHNDRKTQGVFWLSDSSDERECDASAIVRPGVIARFDVGFIGIGNPEIFRDKLSRFARQVERSGQAVGSTTFVIVDRYPTGPNANSKALAERSGTCLIQMSMSLWPREVARELRSRLKYRHPLADMTDVQAEKYLRDSIHRLDLLRFLTPVHEEEESESE